MAKRLASWKEGKLAELANEVEHIQKRLPAIAIRDSEHCSRIFARLVLQGKMNAALRLLSSVPAGIAEPTQQVLQKLQDKHPDGAPLHADALLPGSFTPVPSCIFEAIDEDVIRTLALRSHGACGPSGIDAEDMRRMLVSSNMGSRPRALREAIADLTKRLCSEFVDPAALATFLSARLVPLDKGGRRRSPNWHWGDPSAIDRQSSCGSPEE